MKRLDTVYRRFRCSFLGCWLRPFLTAPMSPDNNPGALVRGTQSVEVSVLPQARCGGPS